MPGIVGVVGGYIFVFVCAVVLVLMFIENRMDAIHPDRQLTPLTILA